MRVLYAGYQAAKEQAEMHAQGVSHGDQQAFSEFASDVNSGEWHANHASS
jgi:hypothetical protein